MGIAVGGIIIKAGSKAFKVFKSFFKKNKFNFSQYQKPTITADGKVIPYGKTEADAIPFKCQLVLKKVDFLLKME